MGLVSQVHVLPLDVLVVLQRFQGLKAVLHALLAVPEVHALQLKLGVPSVLDVKFYRIIIVQSRNVPRVSVLKVNAGEESVCLATVPHVDVTAMNA